MSKSGIKITMGIEFVHSAKPMSKRQYQRFVRRFEKAIQPEIEKLKDARLSLEAYFKPKASGGSD